MWSKDVPLFPVVYKTYRSNDNRLFRTLKQVFIMQYLFFFSNSNKEFFNLPWFVLCTERRQKAPRRSFDVKWLVMEKEARKGSVAGVSV